MLYELITNKALLIPLCAWAIAQLLKTLVALSRGKGLDLRYLVGPGGMPSAHSAVVTSLATAVGIMHGFGSTLFAITVILAMVVMYDAAGVRQSASRQASVLNRVIRELRTSQPPINLEANLRELIGHTPFQVIVGGALGVAIAWIWLAIDAM